MLEVSGGSGPPKARVLWGPIGTGGVNRRAVSLRSVFAHEPRVVFRDNKRATSSSAGTTTPRFRSFSVLGALSLFSSASRSFPSILVSSRLSSWLCSPLLASARLCSPLLASARLCSLLLPSSRFASLLVDLPSGCFAIVFGRRRTVETRYTVVYRFPKIRRTRVG